MYETTNFLRFLFLLIIIIFVYKSYCYKCKENFFQDNKIFMQTNSENKTEFIIKNVRDEKFPALSDLPVRKGYDYNINFIKDANDDERGFIKFTEDSEITMPNLDNRNFLLEFIVKFEDIKDKTILKCKNIRNSNAVTDVISLFIKNEKLILKHLFSQENIEIDISDIEFDLLHYIYISFLNNNLILNFNKIKKIKSLENGLDITNIYFGGTGTNFKDYLGSIDLSLDIDDIDFNDKTWVKDANDKLIYILNNIYNYKLSEYINTIDGKKEIKDKKMFYFDNNSFIHISHKDNEYFSNDINFSLQFYFCIEENIGQEIRTLLSTDLVQIYIDRRNNLLFYYNDIYIDKLSTLNNERVFGLKRLSNNFLYHLKLIFFRDEIYLQINKRNVRHNFNNTEKHKHIYIGAKFKSIIEDHIEKTLISNYFNGYIGEIIINNEVPTTDRNMLKNVICRETQICGDSEFTETELLSLDPNLNKAQIDAIKNNIKTLKGIENDRENLKRFEEKNIGEPNKIDLIVKTYDNIAELNWLPPNNIDSVFKYIISIKTKKTGIINEFTISFNSENLSKKNIKIEDFFYPYIEEILKNNSTSSIRIPIKNYRCSNEGKNPNIEITKVHRVNNKIVSIDISVSGGVDFVKDEIIYLIPYIKNKDELKIYVRENNISQDGEYGHPRILMHPENETNCKMCSYKIKNLNNKYMYKIGVLSVNSDMIYSNFSQFNDDDYVEVSFNNTVSIFGKEFMRDKDHVICQNDGTIDIYPEINEDQNLCKKTLKSNIGLDHNKLYDYLNTNTTLNLDTDIRLT